MTRFFLSYFMFRLKWSLRVLNGMTFLQLEEGNIFILLATNL